MTDGWCNATNSWWTEARTEELKTRWANGETGTQICMAMHAISRNAVVGKIYRLKLGPRERTNGAHGVRRPPRGRQVNYHHRRMGITEEPMVKEIPPIFDNPKLFAALEPGDCRWPGAGDGADPKLLFCAAPQLAGYSYCAAHCRIAFAGKPAPKAPRS